MAIPQYDQFKTPEQNLLELLLIQAGINRPIGQEAFEVLAVKAILNIFNPAGGSITMTEADARYVRKALNLSDIPNKPQALANIGGLAATQFTLSLSGLTGSGLIARLASGVAAARELVASGGGVSVTNGNGNLGNPTIALALILQQIAGVTLQDGFTIMRDGALMSSVSIRDSSIGGVPTEIEEGRTYTVIAKTQCPFSFAISVDGQINIDGLLYAVG